MACKRREVLSSNTMCKGCAEVTASLLSIHKVPIQAKTHFETLIISFFTLTKTYPLGYGLFDGNMTHDLFIKTSWGKRMSTKRSTPGFRKAVDGLIQCLKKDWWLFFGQFLASQVLTVLINSANCDKQNITQVMRIQVSLAIPKPFYSEPLHVPNGFT